MAPLSALDTRRKDRPTVSGIISLFTWAFVVSLILAGIVGAVIRELFLWILRPVREPRQMELMKTAVREGIEAFWHREHPGEPMTEPVREQIANTSTGIVLAEMTYRANGLLWGIRKPGESSPAAGSLLMYGGSNGICKGCGKQDLLNVKGYCRECQQKLPPDGGP
jgi:hypothetical protein